MHFALFLDDFGKCLVKDSKCLLTSGFRHLATLAVKGKKIIFVILAMMIKLALLFPSDFLCKIHNLGNLPSLKPG